MSLKETALFMTILLTFGVAWYKVWVEPRDIYLNQVMDCMGEDREKESYKRCAKQVQETMYPYTSQR